MQDHTDTERAIAEMRKVIFRHEKGITAEDFYEEVRTEAQNLSAAVVKVQ